MLKTVATLGGGGGNGSGTVTEVDTAGGLTGGPITTAGTVSIANTTVTAGTYGDATHVPQIIVNSRGQLTSAANVAITAGSGTVSSVGLAMPSFITVSGSPVTTAGTLTGTLANQTQNLVFASPNAATGQPTFRALVAADIPALPYGTVSSGTTPNVAYYAANGTTISDGGAANVTLGGIKMGAGQVIISSGVGNTAATTDGIAQTFSGGLHITSNNLGTISTGNLTLDCGNGPQQYITNNGAFTMIAPSSDGNMLILVTNGSAAGTITPSGFSPNSFGGDALTTANASKFMISVMRINSTTTAVVRACQ